MKKLSLFLSAYLLLGSVSAQKKTTSKPLNFIKTETGLTYCIVKDNKATPNAKLGDNVEMHISTHIGDSVLFNSRKMNDNKPVPFQVVPPTFKGDLTEGFLLLSAGDSAIFKISVDSLKKSGAQLLPWMKDGDMIIYEVAMVSVKSAEQTKKENEEKAAKQVGIDDKLLKDYFQKNNLKPTKTASGLYYIISAPGEGTNAAVGQQVTVNYTGKTMDGEPFDSNVDPAFNHVQPFTFGLGQGQVIKGWDEGIALLKKGGKGTLFIPSTLAYGERSPSAKIPANSVLIFDVEVTDLQNAPPPAPAEEHGDHDGHNH